MCLLALYHSMKKALLLSFFFAYILSNAQLDREHWFGPMVDRVNTNSDNQTIYMSTGETTPFNVDVYFNNAVIASYTLSKNNPQKHTISTADRNQIILTPPDYVDVTGLYQPVTMGLYLKGEKPFFASLRFSIYNHGEIQTSKGTAALGNEFRVVMAPIVNGGGHLNFMNSVMATENNTKVTISGFRPDVVFMDEIPRTQFTFELNKGESYLVEGIASSYENHTGYIGAKIVSDKPVVVTNGNFNGQYTLDIGSSDILMDQAVPINKLGKTFVLIKGNGNNSFNYFGDLVTMEKAIIVAVKNNTKIYLNGDTTPIATLNEGEFSPILSTNIPLYEKLRPLTLKEVVGQTHLLKKSGFLQVLITKKELISLIFWGPSGVGKTTIAKLLAQGCGYEFISVSAMFTSISEIK
ncbi:MAG: AAA family ATPase, partial [Chryseobacterium sp.]